ncbi:MAG: hypothetical protein KDA81_11245 [Planctomycetaceae bacterium]|nr:hypothetical protein [Planctomycetaceae bacterium]
MLVFLLCALITSATAEEQVVPKEEDFYRLLTFSIPHEINLEAGAIESLPDGTLAVSTRRGDIYRVHNAWSDDPATVEFELFASGLHEVLGLSWHKGWLYATQRGEVTRLRDTDADGLADELETFNDDWEISGDYHEYAFGTPFDRNGQMWVTLCLTGSFNSNVKYRGWCLRIDEQGRSVPTCSGIRSPGGMGFNAAGDVFYTDNQGPWNGTCSLKWLRPGSFQGHPGGFRWYSDAETVMGPVPQEPESGSRIMVQADRIPEYEPPCILFPYKKMGQSASGIACDLSAGKFGPFTEQFFVADQTFSTVMRCDLEQVNGHYQGACFPFREGFSSGNLSMKLTDDGSLFVGGTNRGWGSRGTKPYALERLVWTGKTPFEIQRMRAASDGFELTLTQPVDRQTAGNVQSYSMKTYTYIFQSSYGSPEVDETSPVIKAAEVSDDGLKVRLLVEGLQRGHVHELSAAGVRNTNGIPLLHADAYYTLNYIPGEGLDLPVIKSKETANSQ